MIRKAIIPIAGLGTRMGPLARAVPKSMFPLVDSSGVVRPVVQYIIDQACAAGVEKVGLIVAPAHINLLRKYFTATKKKQADSRVAIEFLSQPDPMGFGEAVARGAHFVGDEPFMLLLGDHIHKSAAGADPCALQVVKAFDSQGGCAMVGMQEVDAAELPKVGTAAGQKIGPGLYRCRRFIEKPTIQQAQKELVIPDLQAGRYLAHCGIYIFQPEIFECLARLAVQDRPMGQEIQLSDAQSMLLERHSEDYYLYQIAGRAYDTGTPAGYLAAQDAIRKDY
jgi:UTP--glucose-1-phosphate uridylyltransferase